MKRQTIIFLCLLAILVCGVGFTLGFVIGRHAQTPTRAINLPLGYICVTYIDAAGNESPCVPIAGTQAAVDFDSSQIPAGAVGYNIYDGRAVGAPPIQLWKRMQ